MEFPIRDEAEQAFIKAERQAALDKEARDQRESVTLAHDHATCLATRIAELGTPNIYGHSGIKAVIDLEKSNIAKGRLFYTLRADEKTKIELMDSPLNNIEVTRVAEIGVKGSATDTSHPYEIEIGNFNNYRAPAEGEEPKTTNQLKYALKNNANFNIAVEPALAAALARIDQKKSVAVTPSDETRTAIGRATQAIARAREAAATESNLRS